MVKLLKWKTFMKSNNRSYSLNPLFIRDIIFVRKKGEYEGYERIKS